MLTDKHGIRVAHELKVISFLIQFIGKLLFESFSGHNRMILETNWCWCFI